MIKFILTLTFVLAAQAVFSQKKPPEPPPGPPTAEQARLAEKADQCYRHNSYSLKKRRGFYPFNMAARVEFISFPDTVRPYEAIELHHYVIRDSLIRERKTLTRGQIDAFTNLLYNIGFTSVETGLLTADRGANCYMPRNAVLFIDKTGKVFDYMEFCFACERYFYSSYKTRSITFCQEKFNMIMKFFRNQGITYGTSGKAEYRYH